MENTISQSTKTRIPYLDLLKFFAIACVILGHSVEQTTGNDFWTNPIWQFIYSYHMPLFMLLCGYFFSSSLKLKLSTLLKKKFIQLLLPAITGYIISVLFVLITDYNPCPELINLNLKGFIDAFWFLKCVFLCYVIAYLALKLLKDNILAAIMTSILFSILPYGDTVSVNFLLPMFWIGYFCKEKISFLTQYRKGLFAFFSLLFIAMQWGWSGNLTVYVQPIDFFNFMTGEFNASNFYITVYRLLIGIAGSMTFFLLAPVAYQYTRSFRITQTFNHVGKCTLGIYIIQTFLLECLLHALGFYVTTAQSLFVGPLIAIAELTLCYQTVLLIKKNRYAQLLLLGIVEGKDKKIKK